MVSLGIFAYDTDLKDRFIKFNANKNKEKMDVYFENDSDNENFMNYMVTNQMNKILKHKKKVYFYIQMVLLLNG